MPHYRCVNAASGQYFFTVVAERRQSILTQPDIRSALRAAIVGSAKSPGAILNASPEGVRHRMCQIIYSNNSLFNGTFVRINSNLQKPEIPLT